MSSSRYSQKELPRKAAKIRRTFPEPGVEKTELRFVLYSEPGGKYRREKFLREVADFFQEQAKRLADGEKSQIVEMAKPVKQEKPRQTKEQTAGCAKKAKCTRVCPKWEAEPEPGIVLVKDVIQKREPHHEQSCMRARAIRTSLPVVKKLIDRVCELNRNQKNVELTAIQKTAQQVHDDAEKCLASGGAVGDHIFERITRLRSIATTVLTDAKSHRQKTTKTTVVRTVVSSSSVSNVNAVSHGDSISAKNCSLRRRQ